MVWYTRFAEYLRLGPTRTMQRVRDRLCEEQGKVSYKCGGHWSRVAQEWRWQERARAWDIEQAQQYVAQERTTAIALHVRRLELYEDALEMCMEALRAAHLEEMTQEEARKVWPQMGRWLVKLLREERIECESFAKYDETPTLTITADDLAQAQRVLEARLAEERGKLRG
jgi:hypothetical protein